MSKTRAKTLTFGVIIMSFVAGLAAPLEAAFFAIVVVGFSSVILGAVAFACAIAGVAGVVGVEFARFAIACAVIVAGAVTFVNAIFVAGALVAFSIVDADCSLSVVAVGALFMVSSIAALANREIDKHYAQKGK